MPRASIREELPETAILVLSAHVEVEQATDLLASGERSGYLLKSRVTDVDEFIETLERIVKGGSVVDPALVQELVAARRVDDPLDVLSPREREVLALMAEGRSNAGIAHQLWVTEGTVEKHVRSILDEAAPAGDGRRPPARARRDHLPRRSLAVPSTIRRIASAESSVFGRNPAAGLGGDQVREVGLGVSRDQDHLRLIVVSVFDQPPSELQAALARRGRCRRGRRRDAGSRRA